MLQKHHLFRKIVCLLMAFALLLMQTGCGTQSEEIDSSKTTNETAASDPDAEEAKDKFVMLKEVYAVGIILYHTAHRNIGAAKKLI